MEKLVSGIEKVQVSDLLLDRRVQRAGRPLWVAKAKANFNPASLGVLHVSRRRRSSLDMSVTPTVTLPPGLYVIDGWGRKLLCDEMNHRTVLAQVYENLSLDVEARLFLELNFKTNHRPIDMFRIALQAKDEDVMEIVSVLTRHGLSVSDQNRPGTVRAVSALRAVYSGLWLKNKDLGRSALDMTLEIIGKAWGSKVEGYDGALIEGIGMVALAYPNLDRRGFCERLARVHSGPVGCKAMAAGRRDSDGITMANAVATIVVNHYNKARSSRRLERWEPPKVQREMKPKAVEKEPATTATRTSVRRSAVRSSVTI